MKAKVLGLGCAMQRCAGEQYRMFNFIDEICTFAMLIYGNDVEVEGRIVCMYVGEWAPFGYVHLPA